MRSDAFSSGPECGLVDQSHLSKLFHRIGRCAGSVAPTTPSPRDDAPPVGGCAPVFVAKLAESVADRQVRSNRRLFAGSTDVNFFWG